MHLITVVFFILKTIIIQVYSEEEVLEPNMLAYKQDSRYFYFPGDGNGKVYLIDTDEPLYKSSITGDYNSYWLYTRQNPKEPQELKDDDKASIINSNFDTTKNTVFLSHGWKGSCNNTFSKLITSVFLEDGDVNVIVLDYSADADLLYILAVSAVVEVGNSLGDFIRLLTTLGMSLDRTHLVGFSLGAHVVGVAGRVNNGTVKRITALDPAGPLWYNNTKRLQNTDAHYVEVIHTNMLLYGYDGKIGHADFFPNGGILMPECQLNSCSHSQSYYYMAKTVKSNDLIANECVDFNQVIIDTCNGSKYPMGNSDLTKNRTGIFRVDTVKSIATYQ